MLGSNHRESYKARVQFRRKVLIISLLLVFLTFLAGALFGKSGVLMNMQVKAEYRKLRMDQTRLAWENERLKQEIQAMQTNQRKIEAIGRAEFNLGRPGEVVFYFPAEPDVPAQMYTNPPEQPIQ